MTFSQPFWLLLLIPLIFLIRAWPGPGRVMTTFRCLSLLFLLLALSSPGILLEKQKGTVIVVVDRSKSMPVDHNIPEIFTLLQSSRPQGSNLGVVSFGQSAIPEKYPSEEDFAGFNQDPGGDGSNLSLALDQALGLIPQDHGGRILVLSDGQWTGVNPLNTAREAAARGLGIDYRYISQDHGDDLAIERIEAPETVGPAQGFMIHAWVQAPFQEDVNYQLRRGNHILARGTRQLEKGQNRLVFRDLAEGPGVLGYELTVNPVNRPLDLLPENNRARFLVGVKGPKPLLLISPKPQSSLAALLLKRGLALDAKTPDQFSWTLDQLSGYSGLILENTPAQAIGYVGMTVLAGWIEEAGAGLFMTGGQNSFGPGGYFGSPLDPLLPVSMELRQEHRKLSLAMVIALDRSGSMGAIADGGRSKMELANLASAQALDLLSPFDEFGHLAVDSMAHEIVPLRKLDKPKQVRNLIMRVDSGGGGIYVFEALSNAARMLTEATAGTRHILLFADAADAEEPGAYKALLEKCSAGGITVSVVGLGSPTDPDAMLLTEIAKLGGGNIYFTNQAQDLPRIFAQDTFIVSRSTFIDETVATQIMPGMLAITSQPFQSSPKIDGYNLCYLRDGADLAMVSLDSYSAPLTAYHFVGSGRVAGYMGEAGGQYSQGLNAWSETGAFLTSLARWTAGQGSGLPGNSLLTQTLIDGSLQITLHLDPEREKDPFSGLPTVSLLRGAEGKTPEKERLGMTWNSADSLQATVTLRGEETVLPTVQYSQEGAWSLTPSRLPYSPEYQPRDPSKGKETLAELAQIGNGRGGGELAGIWDALPKRQETQSLTTPLLLAALLCLLLEVLERRTSVVTLILGRRFAGFGKSLKGSRNKSPTKVKPGGRHKPAEPKGVEEEPPPVPASGLQSAFNQARDRARSKTRR